MKQVIHSRLLRWTLSTGLFFLILMTILRLIFFIYFRHLHLSWKESFPSFILGLRFDLRIACIMMFVLLVVGSIRPFNPFESKRAKKIWLWILGIAAFLFSFFYVIDFAHYSYLSQRLNASVLNYLEDAGISLQMVWQSYPVIKLLVLLAVATILVVFALRFFYKRSSTRPVVVKRKNIVIGFIIAILVFAVGVFGKIGQYPLRWSDAFDLANESKAYLSLNPFQSFFSTLKFRKFTYDREKTREYYSLMVKQLGIQNPDPDSLNFVRSYPGKDSGRTRPNIVVVICESFSGYKSSMWGNPLDPTPYFNQLCRDGVFFNRCFTPTYGTAKGVWATITGIPDESPNTSNTASRNMAMVNQNLIINDFKGYEKMYFIGGSASWANIRGFLKNNIDSLHLYEQDDFRAHKIDVWGISDKNLFLEANGYLKKQTRPFFAVIQTADNHRPYTIPEEDRANFKKVSFPADTLHKYGYESNDELNAFRFTDYGYEQFIEAAKKENYFNNTVFIFVGDHGIRGNAGKMFPKAWTEQALTAEHTPLLFYAPHLLKSALRTDVCSQIDLLPSAASLTGQAYHNYALGRNLFDTASIHPCAFIIDPEVNAFGIVDSNYYYREFMATGKQQLVSINDDLPVIDSPETQKRKKELQQLAHAYYETARYLLFNNKRK